MSEPDPLFRHPLDIPAYGLVCVILSFLAPLAIVVIQAFLFLKNGYWMSYSAGDAYDWLGLSYHWIISLQFSWSGVYKIVSTIMGLPLSLFLFLFLLPSGIALISVGERVEHAFNGNKSGDQGGSSKKP